MPLSVSSIRRMEQVNQFTDAEAAWLAAAIDGEGSISYYDYLNRSGNMIKSARIRLNMTSKEFIDRCCEIIGIGNVRSRKVMEDHHLPQWVYELNGWPVLNVLEQIVSWLIIKQDKAFEVMAELEIRRIF